MPMWSMTLQGKQEILRNIRCSVLKPYWKGSYIGMHTQYFLQHIYPRRINPVYPIITPNKITHRTLALHRFFCMSKYTNQQLLVGCYEKTTKSMCKQKRSVSHLGLARCPGSTFANTLIDKLVDENVYHSAIITFSNSSLPIIQAIHCIVVSHTIYTCLLDNIK